MNGRKFIWNWEICGYFPFVPQLGMKIERLGRGVTNWIPASVPGSVHADLVNASIIEDPYFGMNSLKCEWVENRWWAYRTEFDFSIEKDRRQILHFGGLDYKCWIYVNDEFIMIHEGSFTPLTLDITNKIKPSANKILVVFESAPDEHSQAGRASHTMTQKSRFSYKWDFSTRMVPVGIWDYVYVENRGVGDIEEVQLLSVMKDDVGFVTAKVHSNFTVMDKELNCVLKLILSKDGQVLSDSMQIDTVSEKEKKYEITGSFPNPEKWFPNGLGKQPLYEVRLELFVNDKLSHCWEGHTGFRELHWIKNEGAQENSLNYCLQVNGERVYLKGVNLTPFDMLIGTVTPKKYELFLSQVRDCNVNLVRVNGVGLVEKKEFYDLCDKYGLLVWQEFIQTSSSMDRTPPTNDEYLKLLEGTSVSCIKEKRNHVCLACYSGGNELTNAPSVTATYDNPNIRFLQKLVDQYDQGRYMFPTSATGPLEFLDLNAKRGDSHDVHGPWNYEGPEAHYKLFNSSDSLLHGELGAEGMCHIDSLEKFLPKEDLTVTSMEENLTWRHHGDWWDTFKRDTKLFGTIPDLKTYVEMSMFIQAEAIRYSLDSNRRRKYQNSGSMMWAFNEPFPNVSNTCLVDYYGVPKMSYYAARDAYAQLNMSIRYDAIVYNRGDKCKLGLYVHNSLASEYVSWNLDITSLSGDKFLSFTGKDNAVANATTFIKDLSFDITDCFPEVFMLRLSFSGTDGKTRLNEYLFSSKKINPFESLLHKRDVSLTWQVVEQRDHEISFNVKNLGKDTALFVSPSLSKNNEFIFCEESFKSLFPDEERIFKVITYEEGKNLSEIEFGCFFQCNN
jgi:beta-mannosidase